MIGNRAAPHVARKRGRRPPLPAVRRDPAVQRTERFALGRLLLVKQGVQSAFTRAATSDLASFGAARQIGELAPGYGCLAVPIHDGAGSLAGAIGFSGLRHRVEDPAEIIAVLAPTAERLTPLLT